MNRREFLQLLALGAGAATGVAARRYWQVPRNAPVRRLRGTGVSGMLDTAVFGVGSTGLTFAEPMWFAGDLGPAGTQITLSCYQNQSIMLTLPGTATYVTSIAGWNPETMSATFALEKDGVVTAHKAAMGESIIVPDGARLIHAYMTGDLKAVDSALAVNLADTVSL